MTKLRKPVGGWVGKTGYFSSAERSFSVIITDIVTPTVASTFLRLSFTVLLIVQWQKRTAADTTTDDSMIGSVNAFYTSGKSAGVALVTTLLVEYLDASRQPAEVRETPDPYSH